MSLPSSSAHTKNHYHHHHHHHYHRNNNNNFDIQYVEHSTSSSQQQQQPQRRGSSNNFNSSAASSSGSTTEGRRNCPNSLNHKPASATARNSDSNNGTVSNDEHQTDLISNQEATSGFYKNRLNSAETTNVNHQQNVEGARRRFNNNSTMYKKTTSNSRSTESKIYNEDEQQENANNTMKQQDDELHQQTIGTRYRGKNNDKRNNYKRFSNFRSHETGATSNQLQQTHHQNENVHHSRNSNNRNRKGQNTADNENAQQNDSRQNFRIYQSKNAKQSATPPSSHSIQNQIAEQSETKNIPKAKSSGFSISSAAFYPSSMTSSPPSANSSIYHPGQYNNFQGYAYPSVQQLGGCVYYYPQNNTYYQSNPYNSSVFYQSQEPESPKMFKVPNRANSKLSTSTSTTKQKKGRKKEPVEQESSSEEDEDETESISSANQIQMNFDEDDYIVGFASFNGSLYFCWQQASKESESQSKIREILTQSSKYSNKSSETLFSTCIKNKAIYAALKKFVKKLIKQNQPYNPYLINSHASILMKSFLLSSNTWLEFSANLPAISNKFAKLKAREVKYLLSEYSTEWNYFQDIDLSKEDVLDRFIKGDEESTVSSFVERMKKNEFSKFKRRSHLLVCSWVCKCPNGMQEVFIELIRTLKSVHNTLGFVRKRLNEIFEIERNEAKPPKMTICELVAKIDNIPDLTPFKQKKPESSIFAEKRSAGSNFSDTFVKEIAVILCLNIFQDLKYKYDFSHKKQKGAANDFKKLYSIVDVETQKQKTSFNAKIQAAYRDQNEASILTPEEKDKLIEQLIQFITYDKEYRCYQRYFDLLKTEEDEINKPFGWFQYPYQLKAVKWLKRLGAQIDWVQIYLNRIYASPNFDPDIIKQIDKEFEISANYTLEAKDNRLSFLDHYDRTFTIDKKGTKDCDDALTILYHDQNCIHIAVHITDIASTILRNVDLSQAASPVDESKKEVKRTPPVKTKFADHPIFQSSLFSEASKRVMSIYIPGVEETYAPCFPRHLSEEALSLIDKKPKEVISHIFVIFKDGRVEFKGVFKGLIQVSQSYSFEEADEKIDSPQADPFWKQLYDCCCAIHDSRLEHGAKKFTPGVVPLGGIDLVLEDNKNGDDPIIHVNTQRTTPSKSSKIITEFSILLNATMARYFYDNRIAGLYKEFYQTYNRLLPESIKDMDIEEFIEVASILDPEGNETNYLAQGKNHQTENYQALLRFENELKQQGSKKTTNISKITTNPTKFYQNIIGVELYMQLSSPLRRWLDLVLQVQLVHYLNTIESGATWTGIENSLFSEEVLHYWSEKVSDKIETVKEMEKQVLYHYFLKFLKNKMESCDSEHFILECVSEINFRKGKRLSHSHRDKSGVHRDYNNLINRKKPVFTQLLRLRLVEYNYFAIEAYVTSNTIDMDEMTAIKIIEIDTYCHTISAEYVK
ncbi:hypothetical protein FDP41_006461 [Naegleria fowleri]|uniref:RNB domain-containing protein n=1 Tax=Naegleria fowleri TaxID=5763 RepID=A0A6A5BNE0_NAEFO|nr:uncharacterized protein FDP41_006461 [Naegleria fowleri]KAF0974429.1 hypothetical protein FDP41_006461 [Naegleria fowleri]CAG4717341.1 unnamed protein product [Naegleria fowleri]